MTKYQLKILKFYARCRHTSALSQAVRASILQGAILLLFTGAGFAFFQWGGWPTVAWVYFGIFVSAFLRDVRAILVFCRNWPILVAFIDWERVSEILKESDDRAGSKGMEGQ